MTRAEFLTQIKGHKKWDEISGYLKNLPTPPSPRRYPDRSTPHALSDGTVSMLIAVHIAGASSDPYV
jgi:hypothetical protein